MPKLWFITGQAQCHQSLCNVGHWWCWRCFLPLCKCLSICRTKPTLMIAAHCYDSCSNIIYTHCFYVSVIYLHCKLNQLHKWIQQGCKTGRLLIGPKALLVWGSNDLLHYTHILPHQRGFYHLFTGPFKFYGAKGPFGLIHIRNVSLTQICTNSAIS